MQSPDEGNNLLRVVPARNLQSVGTYNLRCFLFGTVVEARKDRLK